MLDIKLGISEICERMTVERLDFAAQFVKLDSDLCDLEDADKYGDMQDAAKRSLNIARTRLEESLMYTMKTLAIMSE